MKILIKRIYEPQDEGDGFRVLVDRLWPRGLSKAKAALDLWDKEVAPSPELRQWFNHEEEKWPEFRHRYLEEIKQAPQALEALWEQIKDKDKVTLLYGARDAAHNQAVLLKEYLEKKK